MEKIRYEFLAKKVKGMSAIYVQCTQYRKSVLIDTNVRVFPDNWDAESSCVVNHPNAKKLNIELRKALFELEEYEFSFEGNINIHSLNKMWSLRAVSADFYKIIEENLPNREIRNSTKRIHYRTFELLKEYTPHCQIADLTEDFTKGFYQFLKDYTWHCDRSFKGGTVNMHMEGLRTYYNLAKKMFGSKVPSYSFEWYKFKEENPVIKSITEDDIRILENYTAKMNSIVVDQFLFLCYTGMRFSDFISLSAENITVENGKMWITYTSVKTNVFVRLPISSMFNSRAEQIIYKYWNRLMTFFAPGDNSTWNRKLNRHSRLSGLNKHLSAHMGRHTCATRLLQKGIALTTIQKVVGHRKLDTTLGYAKITEDNLSMQLAV